jgi:serine/threonine protein phosphatase PrpC
VRIRYAAGSDMGRVRKNNEDAFIADPSLGIFAVADGLGGHASGEVASRMALDSLQDTIRTARKEEALLLSHGLPAVPSSPAEVLVSGILQANQRINEASLEKMEYEGMGTTLVAVYFSNSLAIVAHVGDSRLYRLRGQAIEQITEDHSLVWQQYKQGLISKEALSSSPHKNIVTRALGLHPAVDVEVKELAIQPGDFLILCSDGLSDMVNDEEMVEVLKKGAGNLARSCGDLIHLANRRGGKDNITVLLILVDPL